jgi:two-component system, NarL family, sensor histidine kinase UhpB
MTLRLQINLIVGVLTLLFVLAVLGLQLRNIRDSVREEVVAANRVATQLLDRTVWRYAAQGTPAMLGFLQGVGRVRSTEITLFDASGRAVYNSPPSPYKAGRDAPPWFAALVQPPLAAQSIAFPDGRLVLQANASRAVLDAWDEALALLLVALGLLLVVNTGVYALVGRTVRPFGKIVAALGEVEGGRFGTALPSLPGREAGAIGAAFNRMVGELQHHIDTERRAVRAEMQLSDSRELTRWIEQHIEQERRLIARELHDELGQSVTAMRSMALSIAQRVHTLDPQAESAARLIADESSRLYDAMHGIIPRLSPLVLDHFGLGEALGDLVERTRRTQPEVSIHLQLALGDAAMQPDAALALYRATQEGLTNALRHGQATRLTICLTTQDGGVELTVTDDGRGLPADGIGTAAGGHHGLLWLAERVQALDGRYALESAPTQGARLTVWLPLPATAGEPV